MLGWRVPSLLDIVFAVALIYAPLLLLTTVAGYLFLRSFLKKSTSSILSAFMAPFLLFIIWFGVLGQLFSLLGEINISGIVSISIPYLVLSLACLCMLEFVKYMFRKSRRMALTVCFVMSLVLIIMYPKKMQSEVVDYRLNTQTITSCSCMGPQRYSSYEGSEMCMGIMHSCTKKVIENFCNPDCLISL